MARDLRKKRCLGAGVRLCAGSGFKMLGAVGASDGRLAAVRDHAGTATPIPAARAAGPQGAPARGWR
ncbi:MAG: hypothetical protein EB832_06005 [Thaumarchaeota archaeon S14]|nr:MAG: hypothetical protein EB832_06005 [Thaumarchaeota archaeon S14]